MNFLVHAFVDKVKGMITNKFGWTYKDFEYWWAFGVDQEAHNITHFVYIIAIVWANGIDLSAALPVLHP